MTKKCCREETRFQIDRLIRMEQEIKRHTAAFRKRWIPTSDELPDEETDVLTFSHTGHQLIDSLYGGEFLNADLHEYAVTHWMPLPPKPEDAE